MENETARGAVRRCQAVTRTDARRYMRPLGAGGRLLAAESRSSGTRPALWGRPGPRIGSPTNAAGQDPRLRAAKAPERGLGAGAKIGRSTRSCGGWPESMPFGSTSRSASLGLCVEGQDALEVVIDGTDGELDLDERQAETVRHRLFPRISSPPALRSLSEERRRRQLAANEEGTMDRVKQPGRSTETGPNRLPKSPDRDVSSHAPYPPRRRPRLRFDRPPSHGLPATRGSWIWRRRVGLPLSRRRGGRAGDLALGMARICPARRQHRVVLRLHPAVRDDGSTLSGVPSSGPACTGCPIQRLPPGGGDPCPDRNRLPHRPRRHLSDGQSPDRHRTGSASLLPLGRRSGGATALELP